MSAALPLPGLGGHAAVLRAMARKVGRVWWLILPVLGATALATMSDRPLAVAGTFCVTLAIALHLAWWAAANALLGLNDPLSAHLVPGQLRRLRESAIGVFLVLAAACGGLLGLVFDHALAFTMGAAAMMLSFAICLRWPTMWLVIWVLPWIALPPLRELPLVLQAVDVAREWHARQPFTQTGAVLLLLGAALWRLFQSGGAAHAESWRLRQRLQHLMTVQGSAVPATTAWPRGPLAWLGRCFQWAHPLWREHLLRTACPTTASVTARAEFATLRGLHWSATGSTTVLLFAVFLIAEVALLVFLPDRAGRVIRAALPGLSIGLMSAMIGPFFGLDATLHQTRREQALLTLVPGMPRGIAMNRVIGLRLLRHHLVLWAAGVLMMLVMQALAPGQDDGPGSGLLGLNFAAVALPGTLLIWRDWSRQGVPKGARTAMLTMLMVALVGLSVGATSHWHIPPLWQLAASILVTAVLGAWRWRALQRMAPFWPVGRHAGG
ncbi:hypothetical protein CS062_02665 [Roseateles chitinivorans]|uniref:Uncharacterized protein n=1 Tax=Roseateles chitinivorans TaxID=2917965 RepID=A0A2G9CGR1_9BURK|nr:hypothetical protein [Roseateles chitinivorans]PIM54804.1 hypothetical protein CS062_02665 [Roseateles chitinivorans]